LLRIFRLLQAASVGSSIMRYEYTAAARGVRVRGSGHFFGRKTAFQRLAMRTTSRRKLNRICWRSLSGSASSSDFDHHRRRRISFLTDVEGDRDYLDRFVELSRVLTFKPTRPSLDPTRPYFPYSRCVDFVCDSGCLVYGGDVWDQGGSDLYVVRQLLSLKERFPDRVFIVMGNRDMNKMRVAGELGEIGSGSA